MRAPAKSAFQAASANLNPWTEDKVDTENPERGPMLILVGEKDQTVPYVTPRVLGTIAATTSLTTRRGWHVVMVNDNSAASATIQATVVCLGTSRAASAATVGVPASVRSQIRVEVAAMRARR